MRLYDVAPNLLLPIRARAIAADAIKPRLPDRCITYGAHRSQLRTFVRHDGAMLCTSVWAVCEGLYLFRVWVMRVLLYGG